MCMRRFVTFSLIGVLQLVAFPCTNKVAVPYPSTELGLDKGPENSKKEHQMLDHRCAKQDQCSKNMQQGINSPKGVACASQALSTSVTLSALGVVTTSSERDFLHQFCQHLGLYFMCKHHPCLALQLQQQLAAQLALTAQTLTLNSIGSFNFTAFKVTIWHRSLHAAYATEQ